MASAAPTPTQPRALYRQVEFLRDATIVVYLVYILSGGLQRLLLHGGAWGEQEFGAGSLINQAMTLFVLGSALVCAMYNRTSADRLLHGALPYLIPTALILLSILWSDYPAIGMRRAIRFALELIGLLVLVSCFRNSNSFLRTIWIAFAILLLLDIVSIGLPQISVTDIGFAGVHNHKNTLGSFCYAAIPLFFIAWRSGLWGRWSIVSLGFMLVALGFLAASQSKTAIFLTPVIGLMTYAAYHLWRRGRSTQAALGAMFAALVVVLALPLAASGMNLAEAVGAVTGDPTMTGRAGVWEYTFWRMGDRAFTGVGYGSFWDVDAAAVARMNQYGVTFAFNQAHSGYVGVFAELGWLGIAAIAVMWVTSASGILRRATNAAEWPLVAYALYISLGYLLYNVTETSFFRTGFDTWTEYVLISAAAVKLVPKARPPKARRVRRQLMAPRSPLAAAAAARRRAPSLPPPTE